MTKEQKHHAGQKPVTIWLPEALAAQLDRKLADAAQPGLRPSRSGFIMHAVQRALQGAADAPLAPVSAAPTAQPVAQAVAPAAASDDLRLALRALFRARKVRLGTDDKFEMHYRDQTEAELVEADIEGDTLYQNLLDFARAGAAGLTEASFCPVIDGWAKDQGPRRARVSNNLFSVFKDINEVYGGGIFDTLPGVLAEQLKAREQHKAKAAEKAAKEAQRAAKRAARAAKAESAKAEQPQSPAPAPSPPVPVSPFGPSEPTT